MKTKWNLLTLLLAALFIGGWAAQAEAAKWWNPLTWFEKSADARSERLVYDAGRAQRSDALAAAKKSGDKKAIRQAREEMHEYNKAHKTRMNELRKETRGRLKQEHKAAHKAEIGVKDNGQDVQAGKGR